jgi:outer membrane protein assembly factor BamB
LIASVRKPGFRIGASFEVSFSDDGCFLASVGKRSNVWDVRARKRCAAAKPFSHENHIDIAPDSRRIVVKNTLGDVAIYDIDLVVEHVSLSGEPYGEGDDVRFSFDANFIVDSSWRGDFLVRDSNTGEVVWKSKIPGQRVTCRRDRMVWCFATDEGLGVQRWPFWDTSPTVYPYPDDRSGFGSFALADSGDRVAVATPGAVEVWALEAFTGRAVVAASWPTAISGTGDAVAWHPSGTLIAHAGARSASILTAELAPIWHEPFPFPSDVAFSADGCLLAVGDWSKGAVFALAPS